MFPAETDTGREIFLDTLKFSNITIKYFFCVCVSKDVGASDRCKDKQLFYLLLKSLKKGNTGCVPRSNLEIGRTVHPQEKASELCATVQSRKKRTRSDS